MAENIVGCIEKLPQQVLIGATRVLIIIIVRVVARGSIVGIVVGTGRPGPRTTFWTTFLALVATIMALMALQKTQNQSTI